MNQARILPRILAIVTIAGILIPVGFAEKVGSQATKAKAKTAADAPVISKIRQVRRTAGWRRVSHRGRPASDDHAFKRQPTRIYFWAACGFRSNVP